MCADCTYIRHPHHTGDAAHVPTSQPSVENRICHTLWESLSKQPSSMFTRTFGLLPRKQQARSLSICLQWVGPVQ